MAKHKKRRSLPPNPPPDPLPPVEPPPVEPPPPPIEPAPENIDIDNRKRKLDQLYWMRIALAVIAGAAATFLFEPLEGEERRWASIGFMIVLFTGTVVAAKLMRIQLPSSDRKKIITQALPSYVLLYLFVWILSYTILHSMGGVSPPPF